MFVTCYVQNIPVPRDGAHEHHVTPQSAGGKHKGTVWLCATCHSLLHRCEGLLQRGKTGEVQDLIAAAFGSVSQRTRMKKLVQHAAEAFQEAKAHGVLGDGLLEIPRPLYDRVRLLANESRDPITGHKCGVERYVILMLEAHLRTRGIPVPRPAAPAAPTRLTSPPPSDTLSPGSPLDSIATFRKDWNRMSNASIDNDFTSEGESPADAGIPASSVPSITVPTTRLPVVQNHTPALVVTSSEPVPTTAIVTQPTQTLATIPAAGPGLMSPESIREGIERAAEEARKAKEPRCGNCLWLGHATHGDTPCKDLHTVSDSGVTNPITETSPKCDDFEHATHWTQAIYRLLKIASLEDLTVAKRLVAETLKNVSKVKAVEVVYEDNDLVRWEMVNETGDGADIWEGNVVQVGKVLLKVQAKRVNDPRGGNAIYRIVNVPRSAQITIVQRAAETRALEEKARVSKKLLDPEEIKKAKSRAAKLQMRIVRVISKLENQEEETGAALPKILEKLDIEEKDTNEVARVAAQIDALRDLNLVLRVNGEYKLGRWGVHAAKRIPEFAKDEKLSQWDRLVNARKDELAKIRAKKAAKASKKN